MSDFQRTLGLQLVAVVLFFGIYTDNGCCIRGVSFWKRYVLVYKTTDVNVGQKTFASNTQK